MSLKSTPAAYGAVAAGLHWLSVVLIVALLGSGMLADETSDPATKTRILAAHAPMGIAILILTLARIFWWWRFDTRPQPLPELALRINIAKAMHGLLYIVVLGMAASGIGMFVLSGAGDVIFGGAALPLPDFADYTPRIPHGIGGKLLLALVIGHAGAALYHHFVKRDATLKRMWFSR